MTSASGEASRRITILSAEATAKAEETGTERARRLVRLMEDTDKSPAEALRECVRLALRRYANGTSAHRWRRRVPVQLELELPVETDG